MFIGRVGEYRYNTYKEVLDAEPTWRNPELVADDKGFRVKAPRARPLPSQINGVILVPKTRSGAKFCAGFQSNQCVEENVESREGVPYAL